MDRKSPVIAIVDDQESVCKAVERLLRSAGMQAVTFSSGAEFLQAMLTCVIDCALIDLHMPGLNGFDVQTELMHLGKWPPIIFLTGHEMRNERTRAFDGGAVAYLLKPVDDKVLIETITNAIANRKS